MRKKVNSRYFFKIRYVKNAHLFSIDVPTMHIRALANIFVLFGLWFCYPFLLMADENHPFLSEQSKQLANDYYQKNLVKNTSAASSSLERVERKVYAKQAFDSQDWYGSRYGFERVLIDNEKDFQAWILLAKTYIGLQSYDTYQNYDTALQASLIKAYQFAQNDLDRATVNWLAAQTKLQYGELRDMALKSAQQSEIENHLQQLMKHYPKEFTAYQLDIPSRTDLASACISFTYPLMKTRDFHYEQFIKLSPKVSDLSVIARGKQLCIEGLSFGQNYQLTFAGELPSADGAKLGQDQTLGLSIPHRKPAIRFREKGYILANGAPQVVPFVAVNVTDVKIKIIHVPERNISAVETNWFTNQIARWDVDHLENEQGQVIWQGTYRFPSEKDKTAVSGLPIEEMIGKKLQPGVYVIEARTTEDAYDNNEFASQALVISDIGLSTYSGPDGLHVYARSLSNAKVMPGVNLSLIARNNRELAKTTTKQNGSASFAAPILHGKGGNRPAFITASIEGKQFTVLNLKNEAFDLSDRGTQGRSTTGPIEGTVFTERGIYRPGETVHLACLTRDNQGNSTQQLPLTLKLLRPDGVIANESVLHDAGNGSYTLDYVINGAAQTGHWTAAIYVDPNGTELSHTTFEVNDFVPPRIAVKSQISTDSLQPHENGKLAVQAQYYFGPPASNLKVTAEAMLTIMTEPFSQWRGYQFGLIEEAWAKQRFALAETVTDAQGKATLDVNVKLEPQTTHPLQVETSTTVHEIGGRAQLTKSTCAFWHQPYLIGIAPRFENNLSGSNTEAAFSVIAVNQQGALQATGKLRYTLLEEQHDYVWFRSGSHWQYEVTTRDHVVSSGTLQLDAKAPTPLAVPVKYGSYRLEILDEKTGVASSVRFAAGWFYSAETPDRPDMLEMSLAPEPSASPHKVKVQIKSPFSGDLFIAIAGQTFTPIHTGKITEAGLTLELAIPPAQRSQIGNYLLATVFRPADEKTSQMPKRAIGVTWFENKAVLQAHKLDFTLNHPATIKSGEQVTVEVKTAKVVKDLRVMVALVDEGTLSLTDFKTPDPFAYFFSKKKLAFALRDSYGHLINPYGAKPGSFEVGGGSSVMSRALTQLPARTYKVVSLFSGVVAANSEGHVHIPFTLPEYTGKLRVMAVAWDDKAVGKAQSDIIVKDPMDVYVSLPRFLAANDHITFPVILKNMEAPAGEYQITLTSAEQSYSQKHQIKQGEELRILMPLQYVDNGIKKVTITLQGPQQFHYQRQWEITVRPKVQTLSQQHYGKIESSNSLTLNDALLDNFAADSLLILSVGTLPELGRTALIQDLLQYPYYCLEQTTSRLFATAFSDEQHPDNIEKGYNQLITLQKIDGSFSLWTQGGQTEPWLTLYAADMLQLMQQKGFNVPSALTLNLSAWIKEAATRRIAQPTDAAIAAYAHYLLAKQQQGTLRELRFFADNDSKMLTERHTLAFIGAAFAHYSDAKNAAIWFDKAIQAQTRSEPSQYFSGFGSELRDQAILVTLLAETTQDYNKLYPQVLALQDKAKLNTYLSTQEKAWLIRADNALQASRKPYDLLLNTQALQGIQPATLTFDHATLLANPVLHNKSAAPVYYALAQQGEPIDVSKVPQNGFKIARQVYTLTGTVADLQQLQSGERYIVQLKGQRLNTKLHHVLLVDLLPAGFEIERGSSLEQLAELYPWLGTLSDPSRTESRDDRFMAAFELAAQNDFTVAYLVRAVTPGTFAYPPAFVEAMYQPSFFAFGEAQSLIIHAK